MSFVEFAHPSTKRPLVPNSEGDLCYSEALGLPIFKVRQGSYDFASVTDKLEERRYYDSFYRDKFSQAPPLDEAQLYSAWDHEPAEKVFLESLGDLNGKVALILGNGVSTKELVLALKGGRCIYTDLSLSAIECMKHIVRGSGFSSLIDERVEFHAVDAMALPFAEAAFDIVYGSKFAHHVEDTEILLTEVKRCLKPGGVCRFLDDAYSPIWQNSKKTVLRPLQVLSHKRGISPEDRRATEKGGYTAKEIALLRDKLGFASSFYERRSFFRYLLRRGVTKLGGRPLLSLTPVADRVDEVLLKRTAFIQNNGIRLVWGFTK